MGGRRTYKPQLRQVRGRREAVVRLPLGIWTPGPNRLNHHPSPSPSPNSGPNSFPSPALARPQYPSTHHLHRGAAAVGSLPVGGGVAGAAGTGGAAEEGGHTGPEVNIYYSTFGAQ